WLLLLRVALVAVGFVSVVTTDVPARYHTWGLAVSGFFAAVTAADVVLALRPLGPDGRTRARMLAIAGDAAVALGYVGVFSYQPGQPYRALYLIPIAEAGLRFGI